MNHIKKGCKYFIPITIGSDVEIILFEIRLYSILYFYLFYTAINVYPTRHKIISIKCDLVICIMYITGSTAHSKNLHLTD